MEKNEQERREVGEDTTKYGEFISSYFAWVSLPEQKEKVEKLEEITENKNEENDENQRKNEKSRRN